MDILELKQTILNANNAYRKGKSIMSDASFDELVDMLKSYISEDEFNEFRDSLNEGYIEHGTKIQHKYVMGSLNKIKNSDAVSLDKFIKEHITHKLNISAKVDGISSVAKYVNGKLVTFASRGNGYNGVLFTDKAPYIKGLLATIPCNDELYVRGELVILNSEEIDSETNYRNICAGYMNSKYWNKEDIEKISFIPYSILGSEYTKTEQFTLLKKFGFNVAWNENIDPKTNNLSDYLTTKAKLEHDYSCDGLVITDSEALNEFDVYRPKNCFAFKINELTADTRIIDIDWSRVSKDGFITPVFILEPVELGGAVISRASASNLDIIEGLGAKYGSVVRVTKSNDIIPHIDFVIDNTDTTDIEFPTECPCCGTELIRDGINLRCTNKSCKDQIVQQLTLFIKKLGCKYASNATLEKFNIYSYKDLIDFVPNEKYKTEVKLYNELLTNVFTKSKQDLLAATNFVGLSEKLINKIVDFYGFENIENGIYNGLPSGVGEITLSKFKESILENLNVVNIIINDSRYNFIENTRDISGIKPNNSNGMSICFTGKLNTMTRSEASKKAESFGFEVKTSVKKDLTYLVTNDKDTNSSKGKNARKFGVKIISEDEFLKMCDNVVEDIMNI